MATQDAAVRRIFGERASYYTTSASHTDPQVLARVVALAAPNPGWWTLDVATGTGHTALAVAPHVAAVVAADLTPEMLAEAERLRAARAIANVHFSLADVHALPFGDASFDLLTCRRAAHHFADVERALAEMARVVRRRGRLVIDDRSVPEDDFVDSCLNELDRYHDESHVREYRPSEWRHLLEAVGLTVEVVEPYTRHRPLTALTDGASPPNVRNIYDTLARLTLEQQQALNLAEVSGEPYLNQWFVMLRAGKP